MAYDRLVRAPRPTRDVSLRPRSAFTLTGSASRAPGATRRKAERALHRSTGRAARLSWTTRGRRRLARGLMFISVNVEPFFFQAEDGIRDLYVTGVQTCALPI